MPDEFCAVAGLYLPSVQFVQAADETAVDLYLPATHADTLLPEPVYPASATQSDNETEATPWVSLWGGQASQASLDIADSLYVDVGQADTLLPLPVYPASARQSDSWSDALGLLLCAGQPLHDASERSDSL